MCVAVDGTADSARSTRPQFNTGDTTIDRPSHKTVDRYPCVGANGRRIDGADVSTMDTHDNPAHTGIGHEHIGAAAKNGDRDVRIACDRDRVLQILTVMQVEEPIGRSAYSERCQRRQGRAAPDAIRPECSGKAGVDIDHAFNPSSADSCSRNAAIASARVHSANSIQSPGANCPAIGRSAVMTVPIFGYPPVVWRSALSKIGCPGPGTSHNPTGGGPESMSALAA